MAIRKDDGDLLHAIHMELSICLRRAFNGWPELTRASKHRLEKLLEQLVELAERQATHLTTMAEESLKQQLEGTREAHDDR